MPWPLSCSKPLEIEKRAPGYPRSVYQEHPVIQRQTPPSQFSVRLLHKPLYSTGERTMNSIGLHLRCSVSSCITVFLFAAVWLVSDSAYTKESPALRSNPFAEQWVLKQVTAGKIADLKERFPKEADRVLSAAFLAKLLTDSPKEIKVYRHGIHIKYAILTEPVDLENGEILYATWLENCR